MTDTILINGKYDRIESLRPACKYLRDRTRHRTKEACVNSSAFLPVYGCELFVRCSPYGNTTDPQLIKPCGQCEEYDDGMTPLTTYKVCEDDISS